MFEKQDLIRLVSTTMPFGKYQGRTLIDLPEEYLLWFANKGMPQGQLGTLLALALEIKINGLENILEPLKQRDDVKKAIAAQRQEHYQQQQLQQQEQNQGQNKDQPLH